MKKATALTIIMTGLVAGVQAQGLINFSNVGLPGFNLGVASDIGGPLQSLNPGTYTVAFYWDSTATAGSAIGLDPSSPSLTLEKIYTTQASDIPIPGAFQAGTVTISGLAAGSSGFFEIVGWTGSASSYNAALLSDAYVNYTPLFNNTTGGAGTPPSAPADLTGWNGNVSLFFIPEPTTLAIGGLGAATLMLFRRQK